MIYIYLLICPIAGITRYVGITRHLRQRMCQHRLAKSTNLHLNRWISKLKLLGLDPIMQVVYSTSDEQHSWEVERMLIASCRRLSDDLINLGDGGEGGQCISEATRKKMSEARKRVKGKYRMTDEHKEAISKSLKGRPNPNPKGFVKWNKSRTGIPLSLEHKRKLSESLTGRKMSNESKAKMREAAKLREAKKRAERTTISES